MPPNSRLTQNGPIHVSNDYSLFENHYAWTNVADYVWIDQPVYANIHLRGDGSNNYTLVGLGSVPPIRVAMVSTLDAL